MKSQNASFDISLVPKLPDSHRQHLHIPKNYTNISPLRNKQNILKTLKKPPYPKTTENSLRLSPILNQFYQKIIEKSSNNKENHKMRSLSVERSRFLSKINTNSSNYSLSEQKEVLDSYKNIQSKLIKITRNKLPSSLRKFK